MKTGLPCDTVGLILEAVARRPVAVVTYEVVIVRPVAEVPHRRLAQELKATMPTMSSDLELKWLRNRVPHILRDAHGFGLEGGKLEGN